MGVPGPGGPVEPGGPVDVLGCHWGLPPGPVIDIGGMPGPPGPKLLLGGGPLKPGPYEVGPIGPIDGPLGGFILGFMGLMPGGPTYAKSFVTFLLMCKFLNNTFKATNKAPSVGKSRAQF